MQISRINYNDLPDNEYEMIKAGTYPAIITKCEYGTAGKNNNTRLLLTFRITEGQYANRTLLYNLWMSYNGMQNANEAEKVNRQLLKTLMNAIGLTHDVEDSDEFLGGECLITVNIDENGKNNIKSTRPLNQNDFSPTSTRNEAPAAPSRDTNARTYTQANPSRPAPRRRGE